MPPARIVLWVTSIGGLALFARTLIMGPIPTWIAVTALVAYTAMCTAGVLFPQFEMFGDAVSRAEPGARAVALTFDDGPFPQTTQKVLEALAAGGHKATFFVIGRKAKLYPQLLKDIRAAGHEIALHGYQHDRLFAFKPPAYVKEDIERTRDVIEAATGERPDWFRPPVGYVSSRTASGAKRAKARLVAWSARGVDGIGETDPDRVVARVTKKLRDGAIVLLHDAAEHDDFVPATIDALPKILAHLDEQGLRAVTLSELLSAEEEPEPSVPRRANQES